MTVATGRNLLSLWTGLPGRLANRRSAAATDCLAMLDDHLLKDAGFLRDDLGRIFPIGG